MSLNSTITALGNSIINLVNKRAKVDLSNISSDGENVIKEIAGGSGSGGASRNIGEIVASTVPLTDAGLHLLDGSLISGSGSYADFVTYIAGLVSIYPDLFETESNWQTAVTTYGVCGKFVYDSVNNTVRLPKYNSKIYTGGGTAPVVGNGMALGLTGGVTNEYAAFVSASDAGNKRVATRLSAYGQPVGGNYDYDSSSGLTTKHAIGVTPNPDKSGIITQLSDITTSLDGYYYIVITTSTKTDIQVDIDEIATDLNGKADTDLSNISNTSGFRKLVEVYNNGTSWYKVFREYNPQNGSYVGLWCEQGGITAVSTALATVNFLKTFRDTNYTINLANSYIGDSGGGATSSGDVSSKTTSSMQISQVNGSNRGTYWEAKGYIN